MEVAILIFVFGLVFGSFYNVVGIRMPIEKSIVKPGSQCPSCKHGLSWYENIPVISYLFLMGKCRKCKRPISIMYPAIELLTGLLFLFSYSLFGVNIYFFIAITIASLLVIVYITDALYMIILDEALIVSGILIFIFVLAFEGIAPALITLRDGVIIFAVVYLLMLFGNFLFKKESLGGGDIKLSFIAGMVLGPFLGVFYLVLASFLAFPYAVYVIIKNNDGILPFGPFLATSLFFCFINSAMLIEFLQRLLLIN